jgi:hypothetical protein
MKKILSLLSLILISDLAFSQNIIFEGLTAKGTGCPDGTVSTALTPDGKSMAVFFDEFRAEVPNSSATPHVEHKTCHLSFSYLIPEGQKLVALEVSVNGRGSTILDPGVRAYVSTSLVGFSGLARSSGGAEVKVIENKMWRGTTQVDESWISAPIASINIQSQCASNGNNRIRFDLKNHLHAEIVNRDLRKSGMIVVDTSDITGQIKFTLKTAPCSNTGGNVTPNPRPRPR